MATQGGTREQRQKFGHLGIEAKNLDSRINNSKNESVDQRELAATGTSRGTQGGSHEQHVAAERQIHKNTG